MAARKVLGKGRASSVFPAPVRAVLDQPNYESAKQVSRNLTGKALTKQTFAIVDKIKEVDGLMRSSPLARATVCEVHPEVCFWGFAGRAMAHSKKKRQGFQERMAVLEAMWPGSRQFAECALGSFLRKHVARDDVVDAIVAALTAFAPVANQRKLPIDVARDTCDLPMEMVYAAAPPRPLLNN